MCLVDTSRHDMNHADHIDLLRFGKAMQVFNFWKHINLCQKVNKAYEPNDLRCLAYITILGALHQVQLTSFTRTLRILPWRNLIENKGTENSVRTNFCTPLLINQETFFTCNGFTKNNVFITGRVLPIIAACVTQPRKRKFWPTSLDLANYLYGRFVTIKTYDACCKTQNVKI